MKTIIIDSNNLIHKVPHLKNLFVKDKSSAQLSLIESVKGCLSRGEKVIFVFDGFGNSKDPNVLFSFKSTADELIRKRIENYSDCRKLKIVSSDNSILNLARVCGCEIQSSEEFWNCISKVKTNTSDKNINQNYQYEKPEKPERMNKKDIAEFKKYFT